MTFGPFVMIYIRYGLLISVPDVPEPKTIYENVVKFIDGYKKEDSDNKKD